MEEQNDLKFMEYVINAKMPFPKILDRALERNYNYIGNIYCPFHENYDTPSAKIYNNKDGDTIWCFSEQKVYRPVDVIKTGLLDMRIQVLYKNIWKRLSEGDREELKNAYGKPKSVLSDRWKEYSIHMEKFKSGEISLKQFQHLVLLATEKEE